MKEYDQSTGDVAGKSEDEARIDIFSREDKERRREQKQKLMDKFMEEIPIKRF